MRTATLTRVTSDSNCTLGDYVSDSGFKAKSLELRWADNAPDVSCVPPGSYLCVWMWSNKHGKNLYHLQNVPNRDVIELHSANVSYQLLGCACFGDSVQTFAANSIAPGMPPADCQGVTNSVKTLFALEKDMQDANGNQVNFTLMIQ